MIEIRGVAKHFEGKTVLEGYRPPAARAEKLSFEVLVEDGCLDILFVHGGADNPKICAIEVQRTE